MTKELDVSNESESSRGKKIKRELEKIPMDRLRGRVMIFDPEKSEFAKNLELIKKGDYFKKK